MNFNEFKGAKNKNKTLIIENCPLNIEQLKEKFQSEK